MVLSSSDIDKATELLSASAILRNADARSVRRLASIMKVHHFKHDANIAVQDEPSDSFHVVAEGETTRLRTDEDGVPHRVDTHHCGPATINSLHVVQGAPAYATARCASETCKTFAVGRDELLKLLENDHVLAKSMIVSLSRKVRARTKTLRTPLMEQKTKEFRFAHVTIAAAMESYYRSALNSVLNQRLSGVKSSLFPNMHIQVPVRVAYINGFKSLRALIDNNVHADEWKMPAGVRFATMVAPGVIMTPMSSVLEACNAGHINSEPIARRSLRGTLPRGVREIIFGVGLNQMSDYFEERWTGVMHRNPMMANVAGSLTAGVIAGYLSHVPHNISTYKLLQPDKGYSELFKMFVDKSAPKHLVPRGLPDTVKPKAHALLAILFPRGVMIRTVQIVGSFIILNGVTYLLKKNDQQRLDTLFGQYFSDGQRGGVEADDGPQLLGDSQSTKTSLPSVASPREQKAG
eukprot:Plantae.Rhodophyta-Hildenbrandia_rubra.ctg23575.p1 GENE.Plantae.Rhodophyta-Hildenbrandia_rubra.ctg23575~~Plantae.Rhodophyta-Hildenbrandia_rubra.ctg23575.p1  ORF type:complete len:464 (-),score=68.60 Plantae.Rhodophyta-Hildenbrandia_rubra.ctg23575:87-1478(-)